MRSAVVLFALVLAFLTLSTSDPVAAPNFSAWGTPANLGAVVNSPFVDAGPAISKNGLSLYFHSNRPGGWGTLTFGFRSVPASMTRGDRR